MIKSLFDADHFTFLYKRNSAWEVKYKKKSISKLAKTYSSISDKIRELNKEDEEILNEELQQIDEGMIHQLDEKKYAYPTITNLLNVENFKQVNKLVNFSDRLMH